MSVADTLCRVSLGDFHAQFFQMCSHFGFFLVRARNPKPQVREDFSDAGHAYAADADEVYVLETSEHLWSADILSAERGHPARLARSSLPSRSGYCPAYYR